MTRLARLIWCAVALVVAPASRSAAATTDEAAMPDEAAATPDEAAPPHSQPYHNIKSILDMLSQEQDEVADVLGEMAAEKTAKAADALARKTMEQYDGVLRDYLRSAGMSQVRAAMVGAPLRQLDPFPVDEVRVDADAGDDGSILTQAEREHSPCALSVEELEALIRNKEQLLKKTREGEATESSSMEGGRTIVTRTVQIDKALVDKRELELNQSRSALQALEEYFDELLEMSRVQKDADDDEKDQARARLAARLQAAKLSCSLVAPSANVAAFGRRLKTVEANIAHFRATGDAVRLKQAQAMLAVMSAELRQAEKGSLTLPADVETPLETLHERVAEAVDGMVQKYLAANITEAAAAAAQQVERQREDKVKELQARLTQHANNAAEMAEIQKEKEKKLTDAKAAKAKAEDELGALQQENKDLKDEKEELEAYIKQARQAL